MLRPFRKIAATALGARAGGDRYKVRTEQGETRSFHSPIRQFEIGDRVTIDCIRL